MHMVAADNKVNVISRNGMFLFRFNNGVFGSKWCGLWDKNIKLADYFAFKVNDEFLSQENINEFKFYNSEFCSYEYSTSDGKIIEEDTCMEKAIIITLRPDFDCEINAEVGINLRERSQNYVPSKRYELSSKGNMIYAFFKNYKCIIAFDKGNFIAGESYGVHTPGLYAKERGFSRYFDDCAVQNKYIPGTINVKLHKGEELNLCFFSYLADEETVYKKIKTRKQHSMDFSEILKAAYASYGNSSALNEHSMLDIIDSMYSYSDFNEKKIYAGFPYFNEFWLRDALMVAPSFLVLNNSNFVKDLLFRVIGLIHDGKLPSTESSEFYPLDIPALFINCINEYVNFTGDIEFFKSNYDKIKQVIGYGKTRMSGSLMHDYGRETWMDSKDREFSIEIQALWSRAFEAAAYLFKKTGIEYADLIKVSEELKSSLKLYDRTTFLSDEIGKDINSCNQIFPLYLGLLDGNLALKAITNIKSSLLVKEGVLSVANGDKSFKMNGYHDGQIWPFITGFAAGGAYFYGENELGKQLFNILLSENFDLQCTSRINEIIQPDGKPQGCPSQTWSMCCLPFIVDRLVLGIEPRLLEKCIIVNKKNYEIKFKRYFRTSAGQINIEYNGKNLKSNFDFEENENYFKILF